MLPSLLLSVVLAMGASTPVDAVVSADAQTPAPTLSSDNRALATPQFRRFGTAEGLPSSTVYTVLQAPDGTMWFGTKSGIARYDGVSFQVFRHVAGDPGSLFNNGISWLLVDHAGRLWAAGLEAGLNRYDEKSGTFRHWGHVASDPASLASDKVWSIAQTGDGTLWVGTAQGLDRMRPDGQDFDHVVVTGHAPEALGTAGSLFVDARDQLWVGSDNGVFRRDAAGVFHPIVVEPPGKSLDAWRIEGTGDEIRVSSSHGLYVVGSDDVARQLGSGELPETNILSSVRDRAGRLWIGTQRGLFLKNGRDAGIQAITNQPVLNGNLPGTWVWDICADSEGGLWIALFDGGVGYLSPGWDSVSRFTHIPDDDNSLRDSVAYAVARGREGAIWVGERDGRVDRLWPDTGRVDHVISGLRGDVLALTEDAPSRLWVTVRGGLFRYANGKLDAVDGYPRGMKHPLEVELGPDGKLYARSFGEGLFRIDQDTLEVTPVAVVPAQEKARWGSQLTLKNGTFWYASDGGMLRLDRTHDHFEPVPGVDNGQPVDAFDFTEDGMWLARPDGLEHYRYTDDGLALDRKIDAARGWPSINVVDLAVDQRRRVWIFGRDGLWRFDTATGQFREMGLQDGVSNGEFMRGFARMPDGMIYSPTFGGVLGFNPNRPSSPVGPPRVAITRIRVRRGGEMRDLPIPVDGKLTVGWNDSGLTIDSRVFSYVDPAANRYRFRLAGLDNAWVDTGSRGERDLTGLAHGDYTLDVMAASADGVWTQLPQPLHIHVDAPPWTRWWAWCVYVVMIVLLTWLALQAWRRRLAERQQILLAEQRSRLAEQASAAKTQFLATLSHEIRTPMTGVMGMAELLLSTPLNRTQREYAEAMQRSGGMLLKLVNDALDLARIEAGKLDLEHAPFDPRALIDDVAQLAQGQAHAKGLRFELDLPRDLPARMIGDALRIKQVLLNLANNALKFTERGSVTLRVRRTDDGLRFSVMDTGPGIPEASQTRLFQRFEQVTGPQRRTGSGLGLAICRELVAMMGGSIELESKVAFGSTFHVRLPLPLTQEPVTGSAQLAEGADAQPLRILLVEDDAIVAAVVRGLLERAGHEVRYVSNGLAALAELAQATCDVILLDLDLPGIDGFQIARLIRQREEPGSRIPIVAITARSGGDEEARARDAGMDGFLRKPLTGDQLSEAIQAQMAMAREPVSG
ncbi:Signal transduction histidine kinase [Dyella jiangningensis]|uniref:hybrid sensor histidine kinase/response regulator n=1 Tax=Dyella sp. AtDHG13 TaxID=1938897 RepID=UPI0008848B22|nr:hybrid sensor histidine kinase/response regulator [Dyella sp. AtDHG13]PXV57195.1 signal transduction histidine kinase [Dyella sp. AtDHG13]SDK34736.1 Signal transduction histidine kinase [Dyella jiangningensis]